MHLWWSGCTKICHESPTFSAIKSMGDSLTCEPSNHKTRAWVMYGDFSEAFPGENFQFFSNFKAFDLGNACILYILYNNMELHTLVPPTSLFFEVCQWFDSTVAKKKNAANKKGVEATAHQEVGVKWTNIPWHVDTFCMILISVIHALGIFSPKSSSLRSTYRYLLSI